MAKSPFVSVVMPVYNCARYLREAIESILSQTHSDFEFLIVNDGSTDQTSEVLSEYARQDSRIKIMDQPNSGIVVALNRGLSASQAEWVFRMDGDDIARHDRFAVQLQALKHNSDLVLIGGWCQQIDGQGRMLKINKYPARHDDLIHSLEMNLPFFPHPTACFRREIVLKAGRYRDRLRHAEDRDLWFRLMAEGKFGCCEQVILLLRKHANNISNFESGRIQQMLSVAAFISHYCRMHKQIDPVETDEGNWNNFLGWLEKELETRSYFAFVQGRVALRKAFYSQAEKSIFFRTLKLVKELTMNPLARKALWAGHREHTSVLISLAKESLARQCV